ncbi:MAG: DUF2975 domain-containing protein [Lactobacillaceae bacterium]|jgi:hypothetical protein|nr:DUF2975 domain-containing protein [Lactobacillaceae bacterium]
MTSKALSLWVKIISVALAVCAVGLCIVALPTNGGDLMDVFAVPTAYQMIYTVIFWLCVLPWFLIFGMMWREANDIKNENVFTNASAVRIKQAAYILMADIAFFACANIALFIFLQEPVTLFIASIFLDIFGLSVGVLGLVLARYLTIAADLQEESAATI